MPHPEHRAGGGIQGVNAVILGGDDHLGPTTKGWA